MEFIQRGSDLSGPCHISFFAISPLPPSVNRAYRAIAKVRDDKLVPMMVKTKASETFKTELQWRLRPSSALLSCPRIAGLYIWNMSSRDGDTDNRLKMLNDACEGFFFNNDKNISVGLQMKRRFTPRSKDDPWKDGALVFFTDESCLDRLYSLLLTIRKWCDSDKLSFYDVIDRVDHGRDIF